jgi:hypothetical protein
MRTVTQPPAGKAELEAARLLLERMGVSLADLTAAATSRRAPVPTFAEYVPTVSAAVSDATRRVNGSYWNKIVASGVNDPSTSPPPPTSKPWSSM